MTRSSAQATKSRVLSRGSHPGLEGVGICAIQPGSAPSPRVLAASPRPPKSPRIECGTTPGEGQPDRPGAGICARTDRRASSQRVSAPGPVPRRTSGVTPNPEVSTDPIFGTIQERAAVFERPNDSSPATSGRFAPASEARSCTTVASIVSFDDQMAAVASELMAAQHAASVAVINSDARAMTAAVAAAQANVNAQIVAARAANEVLQTRNQAKQAL